MLHLSQWTSQFVQNISMTIRHPLSLRFTSYKETLPGKPHSLKGNMGETSGRATEEGSLSQDRQWMPCVNRRDNTFTT